MAPSSVIKWARRYSDTGSAGPSRTGTRPRAEACGVPGLDPERIKACPAITSAGLQDWLGGRGVAARLASIWRFPRGLRPRPQEAGAGGGRARPATADGDAFRAYVETRLVPTPDRGDIVVMDTPGSRKIDAVRAAIRGAGARLLFLPPCSSDPGPIEQAFAKLKRFLRKDQPRSRDDPWKNVGSILEKFTPRECSN